MKIKILSLFTDMRAQSGQLLIELLLVIGILSITLPAITAAILTSRDGDLQQEKRVQAMGFYKESLEALRVIRENDWNTFAVNGTYHPVVSGSTWALAPNSETINGFTRSIIISDAQRQNFGPIVESGGTNDPSTKKVRIVVSWDLPNPDQYDTQFYLTRYLDNLTITHTLEAEFEQGTLAGTAVTNTSGGEVILGSGGAGSWCEPFSSQVAQLDLPKSGVANAISAVGATETLPGIIYAGTGENAAGVSFANVVATNQTPPTLSISGTVDGYKTNDVFGDNGNAYIATDTNSEEIVIISTSSLSKVGYVDLPGATDGFAVVTVGQTGYALAENKLYNFDLSSKNGSRPLLDADGVTLPGTGTALEIVGNYAYVAISGSSTKLQIVDISAPSNLQLLGTAAVNSQNATDVSVNQTGTRAYLATAESSTQREMWVIDTSTKSGTLPSLGNYETNGMSPKTISFVTGNIVLIAGTGGQEYQVLNVGNEASNPTQCGGLQIDQGVNDLAPVLEFDGDAYSYVLTGVADNELRVFQGGPGGQYSSDGTYESAYFEPPYATAFNYIFATLVIPNQTSASYQVAVADPVDGSCESATYFFVGPDGTGNSFYTDEGAIPLNDDGSGYENPGKCFKYKVFFETNDFGSSPILEDITINYSP